MCNENMLSPHQVMAIIHIRILFESSPFDHTTATITMIPKIRSLPKRVTPCSHANWTLKRHPKSNTQKINAYRRASEIVPLSHPLSHEARLRVPLSQTMTSGDDRLSPKKVEERYLPGSFTESASER